MQYGKHNFKEKKFVLVDRPHVKLYNTTMGGVYQLDSGVGRFKKSKYYQIFATSGLSVVPKVK